MTYPTSVTIRAHGPWWFYCGSLVRVREEDGRAWVLLKGGWVYVPSTDQSSWGGPVRLQPGDLVTGAEAPMGAPTWLGMIPKGMDSSIYEHPTVYVRELGYPYPILYKAEGVRRLTDPESAGLAAVLCAAEWKQGVDAYASQARLIAHDGVEYARACPDGRIGWSVQGKRVWQIVEEYGTGNVPGMSTLIACASRALLRWMCEGSRGVDEACVS